MVSNTPKKYVKEVIDTIKLLEKNPKISFDSKTWFVSKKLSIDSNLDISFNSFKQEPYVYLKFEKLVFQTKKIDYRNISTSISIKNSNIYNQLTIRVYGFENKEITSRKKYYYRAILPISSFKNNIELAKFQTERIVSKGLIWIKINNIQFDIFELRNGDSKYFIVEASQKLELEKFNNYLFSIQLAYGYITGETPFEQAYYFGYLNKTFKDKPDYIQWVKQRPTLKNIFVPIAADVYGYAFLTGEKVARKYSTKLNAISMDIFENLCSELYSHKELQNIIQVILEAANNENSVQVKAAVLYVALESLAELVKKEQAKKTNPPLSKNTAKKLRKSFLTLISEEKRKGTEGNFSVLEKRIEQLNNPTNTDKLKDLFQIYGIILSTEDEKILTLRNRFLHGNLLSIYTSKIKEDSLYVFYLYLRLQLLLSKVILKRVGFQGYITNHPKMQQKIYKMRLKEDYYIKI